MDVNQIAKVCHEVNRAYCASLGDHSQPAWADAPDWQRNSAVNGVKFSIENPDAPPSASHDSWLEEKRRDGWKFGPVKNPETKEHPCFVPYDELPAEQRAKDYLFQGVVRSMSREGYEVGTKAHAGLPVAGYKPQNSAAVDLVNRNKALEETVLRALDDMATMKGPAASNDKPSELAVDQRWLAIGRTAIENGFMAVNRSIFKPGRVKLPGDPAEKVLL